MGASRKARPYSGTEYSAFLPHFKAGPLQARIERARNGARAPLAPPPSRSPPQPRPPPRLRFGRPIRLVVVCRRWNSAAISSPTAAKRPAENRPDGRLAICRLMRPIGDRGYEGRVFRQLQSGSTQSQCCARYGRPCPGAQPQRGSPLRFAPLRPLTRCAWQIQPYSSFAIAHNHFGGSTS